MSLKGQLVLRGTRIIVPSKLQPRTLAFAHKSHLCGVCTKQDLRTKVWWPGMDEATERHCRACHGCQLVARPGPPEHIRFVPLPDGPLQGLVDLIDLMEPLSFTISHYYSRVMPADMGCQIPSNQTMFHYLNRRNLENIVNNIILCIRKSLLSGRKSAKRLRDRIGPC